MSELFDYKCPACGGALVFDSESQKLKCPFCDSEFDVEQLKQQDATLDNEAEPEAPAADEPENMSVFTCNSCGGEIVGDETLGATTCPYCGNAVVMSGRFTGHLKPDFIIPFKLDKQAAMAQYNEHIKGKFLLPRLFRDQNRIEEIKGIYVPFWLYDSKVEADATFEARNVTHWSDSKYDYTETSVYSVERAGQMAFENIPCDGSSKMPDDLMESIEPFNFAEAVPFQSAYMAGYFADKYDVDQNDNAERADRRVLNSAIGVLRSTFSAQYDEVSSPTADNDTTFFHDVAPHADMQVLEGKVKYAMFPVWLLTTNYKGERYTFAMNGQTGRFVGDLPVDKFKRNMVFATSFAALTAAATAIIYMLMG